MNKEQENKIANDLNKIAKKHNFINQWGQKKDIDVKIFSNDWIFVDETFSESHKTIGIRYHIETREIEIVYSNQKLTKLHWEIIKYFQELEVAYE